MKEEEYRNLKASADGKKLEGDYITGNERYHFQISRTGSRKSGKKERGGPSGKHWVKGHWQKKPNGRGRMYVRAHWADDP